MQRLSGLDASFLYLETPSSYMHVARASWSWIPATAPVQWSFDEVRDMYAARLHLAPPFRRRLVEVPFGLHHPLWIEDPDFDLDFHLHHIAVPPPGGARQLARRLAEEIVARPLDRRKPLWEAWIIEGLEHGHIAVLTKTHHAAIDGVSGNELTVAMLDTEPEGRDVGTDTWAPERVPNDVELLAYAMSSLATAARRSSPSSLDPHGIDGAEPHTSEPGRPTSPLRRRRSPRRARRGTTRISPHRSYAMTTLSLDDAKVVKNAFGTTLNDVVMAMCASSLRSYLEGRGERDRRKPLVAMVPMSVRTGRPERRRRQPHLVDARVARDDDRRPGRAPARDLRGHAAVRRTSRTPSVRRHCRTGLSSPHRRSLGRAARALRAVSTRRPAPADLQPHDLERAGSAVPALLGGSADGGELPDGAHQRRCRAEHHRAELHATSSTSGWSRAASSSPTRGRSPMGSGDGARRAEEARRARAGRRSRDQSKRRSGPRSCSCTALGTAPGAGMPWSTRSKRKASMFMPSSSR